MHSLFPVRTLSALVVLAAHASAVASLSFSVVGAPNDNDWKGYGFTASLEILSNGNNQTISISINEDDWFAPETVSGTPSARVTSLYLGVPDTITKLKDQYVSLSITSNGTPVSGFSKHHSDNVKGNRSGLKKFIKHVTKLHPGTAAYDLAGIEGGSGLNYGNSYDIVMEFANTGGGFSEDFFLNTAPYLGGKFQSLNVSGLGYSANDDSDKIYARFGRGSFQPIPEPSHYIGLGAILIVGAAILRRRLRK